ncbi:MAG: RNA ligase (ATP) [Leptolyngbyaceae cyanobacterium RM2_2_4]|nr:RNA ligase (ATP) [Leptolyngbyaceae cyanobacterium RM2_2_4]
MGFGNSIYSFACARINKFGLFKKSPEQEIAESAVAALAPKEEVPAEEGSTYKVPFTSILDVQPHNNAERLEVATVYGFQVIVSKGRYKVGDKAVYIPIDSILPETLESKLFPADSKIKLNNHRVRQIKIRGLASQGMLISPDEIADLVNPSYLKDEQDLKLILNVTKYEPPIKTSRLQGPPGQRSKKTENPLFHKYNGLDNIKWFPNKFNEQTNVVIQEKLHGTNARASIMPFAANTLKKKILRLLRLAPVNENCYGSNRVEISASTNYKGFYGEDVYGTVFNKLDVFKKIKVGESVFGEIVGPGIQKGYTYGLKEHKFVLFDVKVLNADGTQTWLSPDQVEAFAKERGFDFVPVLYKGPYNKELAYSLTKGKSEFNDKSEKVREGIVIKKSDDYSVEGNKQALKWVSEDYLSDTSNTDEH